LAWLGGAALVAYGVVGLGNISVYGAFVPQHVATNLGGATQYFAVRREALALFLLPGWHSGLFAAVAIAALANVVWPSRAAARIWIAHLALALMVVLGIGLPAWAYVVRHERFLDGFDYRSLAHTWPFAFTLVYWAWRPRHAIGADVERVLLATSVVFMVARF
jgi:hypothetical protein